MPKVIEGINIRLTKAFVAYEVKDDVFQMNPMSSSGPDGFNASFYQAHWYIVGQDVCRAVLKFINNAGGD